MEQELHPNAGKNDIIEVDGVRYQRLPIKTHLITDKDNILDVAEKYGKPVLSKPGDVLFISEKCVACTQRRAIPLADIKPRKLAGSEGLQASEALSFLKSLDSSKARLPRIDPNGLSLKMLKICSLLIEDGTLRPFSIRWPKSAIISNTDCLIHASTAFRKTGNASTLSLIDILEPRVDEKYFLSPQATARLLYS